ncbi:hypothetical protein GCM10010149_68820 [Nonomuraea roseoviolacea subsp. roseoviolacea]|uniref:Uncharacterized protein n=1 Tax=Nonomuraea roseoviolacea subsp. carminata TaxID=160689 RepID=A0ABT1JXJ2_9ACTN|nr:hypothetical protein [Nonomuraea roseoviolacea]MCP2346315.1 hypothetical protein [Nonomuraea roseoviolacea subsp. carminata]
MADNPLIVVPAPTETPGGAGITWCTLSPNGSALALAAYEASGVQDSSADVQADPTTIQLAISGSQQTTLKVTIDGQSADDLFLQIFENGEDRGNVNASGCWNPCGYSSLAQSWSPLSDPLFSAAYAVRSQSSNGWGGAACDAFAAGIVLGLVAASSKEGWQVYDAYERIRSIAWTFVTIGCGS